MTKSWFDTPITNGDVLQGTIITILGLGIGIILCITTAPATPLNYYWMGIIKMIVAGVLLLYVCIGVYDVFGGD